MTKWIIGISLFLIIGCKSIKPISPTAAELNISEDFNNYIFSDFEDIPIHTIRVSIHVIQDSLGQGNFILTDSTGTFLPEWYWLKGLVADASKRMGELQPMQMESNSRYIKDSRIRYDVVGVYDWQNQELFNLSKVQPSTGGRMYRFIMEQDEVTHKENALHLFIAGSPNKDNGRISSRGIASGAPDKRWSVLFNYHKLYSSNKNYWPASLVNHEIGHNLGLRHTWNRTDGCDDTPKKSPQCWALNEPRIDECNERSKCSNNLMDYNAWQNALTECQLSKIHYNIHQNKGNLKDIIKSTSNISKHYDGEISGTKVLVDNGIYELKGIPAGTPVKWYITPREAVEQSIGSGSVAKLASQINYTGKAIITFQYAIESDSIQTINKRIKVRKDVKY